MNTKRIAWTIAGVLIALAIVGGLYFWLMSAKTTKQQTDTKTAKTAVITHFDELE